MQRLDHPSVSFSLAFLLSLSLELLNVQSLKYLFLFSWFIFCYWRICANISTSTENVLYKIHPFMSYRNEGRSSKRYSRFECYLENSSNTQKANSITISFLTSHCIGFSHFPQCYIKLRLTSQNNVSAMCRHTTGHRGAYSVSTFL